MASSADNGKKYCLLAAVTIELDKDPNCYPIFVPMPKKDSVCALAAIKEALTLCQDRNLHQITCSPIARIQADGGGEFNNQKLKDLCWDKNIILFFSPAHHQASSNGIAERMAGILMSTVRRMLKQAHLERERSYHLICMQVCGSHDEGESARPALALSTLWTTCGNLERT